MWKIMNLPWAQENKASRKAKKRRRARSDSALMRKLQSWRRPALQISSVVVAVAGLSGTGIWAVNNGHGEQVVGYLGDGVEVLAQSAGLTIDEVYVHGRRQTDMKTISNAVNVQRGGSILNFDPAEVRQSLLLLGWVKDASVTRRLPNLILVNIEEREPLALWQKDGRLTLIDKDGEPITRYGLGKFANLPIVVGRGARESAGSLIRMLATQPHIYPQVEAAVRIGDRRWNLRLKNGIEVNLPEEGSAKAWRKLAEIDAEHEVFKRDVATIDLRFPDRLVVRMTERAAKTRRNPGKET
jgi:cell division protein FtsQ